MLQASVIIGIAVGGLISDSRRRMIPRAGWRSWGYRASWVRPSRSSS